MGKRPDSAGVAPLPGMPGSREAPGMGLRNLRAICPNCGGKIHTQPKGLGKLTWMNSWMFVETGRQCQHCGVALTGKVTAGNRAVVDTTKPTAPQSSPAPADETREQYLARINSTKLGEPKKRR